MAVKTGLATPPVHLQLLHEITRFAIRAGEILEGGPPLPNRLGQHPLYLPYQGTQPLGADVARRPLGMNAGGIERLVGVDVAHPDHHLIVHQEGLDGGAASLGTLTQVIGVEGVGERLRPQFGQQRMRLGRLAGPQQGTEAARIIEPQQLAVLELDIHVIVLLGRGADVQHPQAARHAQMEDGGTEVGLQQQVLGAAADPVDGEVHQLLDLSRHRPAQTAVPYHHPGDLDAGKPGRDALAADFDFR